MGFLLKCCSILHGLLLGKTKLTTVGVRRGDTFSCGLCHGTSGNDRSGTRETFQPDRSTTSGAGRAGGAGSFWSLSVSAFLSSALPCFVVFFSLVSNDANVKLIVYIYNHKSVGDPVYCRFRFKLLPFSICFLHVSLFIHLLYLFLYETAVCQETEEGLGYFFGAVLCICFTWTTRPMDLAEDRWLPHKLTQ